MRPRQQHGVRRAVAGLAAFVTTLIAMTASTVATAQEPAADSVVHQDYVVRAGDLLRIRVWPDSTLSGEYPVEETGSVFLPGLGEIHADGRALGDLRTELRQGYGTRLRNPVVTVTPLFGVSVLGAVVRPGLYQVRPANSLFDAISLAGGLRDDASNNIRIVRDGQTIRLDVDQALLTGGGSLTADLRSGDRILVARKKFRINFRDVLYLAQTVAIIVTLATR